jgi:hypothetical protein
MDRKVLFGLVIGAATLAFIGRRRRSSLSGLGWPAVRHALFRSTHSGAARVQTMAADRYAHEGDCRRAIEALYAAEYASGQSSAHATATADEGTQKALSPNHSPRVQAAEAKALRVEIKKTREFVKARCLFVARKEKSSPDPRQRNLL